MMQATPQIARIIRPRRSMFEAKNLPMPILSIDAVRCKGRMKSEGRNPRAERSPKFETRISDKRNCAAGRFPCRCSRNPVLWRRSSENRGRTQPGAEWQRRRLPCLFGDRSEVAGYDPDAAGFTGDRVLRQTRK